MASRKPWRWIGSLWHYQAHMWLLAGLTLPVTATGVRTVLLEREVGALVKSGCRSPQRHLELHSQACGLYQHT